MRALIITKSGTDVINVMNFLITAGYALRNIVTIMSTRDSITDWWKWMTEVDKCFVYIDPSINELNFSSELFTPVQLRSLIFNSPNVKINIFIASDESFELLWIYSISKLHDTTKPIAVKSHLYGQTESNIIVVTCKDVGRYLSDIRGLCYSDIVEYYKMKVSFSRSIELSERFV